MATTQMEVLQMCTITWIGYHYPILYLHGKLYSQWTWWSNLMHRFSLVYWASSSVQMCTIISMLVIKNQCHGKYSNSVLGYFDACMHVNSISYKCCPHFASTYSSKRQTKSWSQMGWRCCVPVCLTRGCLLVRLSDLSDKPMHVQAIYMFKLSWSLHE